MDVRVEKRGSLVVVHLAGSASIYEEDALRAVLLGLLPEKFAHTVLDMSGVDFICSSALAVLVYAHIKNRQHQGQIRLASPQSSVVDVLELTCLSTIIPIYPSLEQAVADLRPAD